jgi:hypothetical protein
MLFTFALEYAIRNIQENQVGLKLYGTHKFLACAGDVNPLVYAFSAMMFTSIWENRSVDSHVRFEISWQWL